MDERPGPAQACSGRQSRRAVRFPSYARRLVMVLGRWKTALVAAALLAVSLHLAVHAQEEKLGKVSFPISCSPEAQVQFNRAVAMLHLFFYPETIKAFEAIAANEPSCA